MRLEQHTGTALLALAALWPAVAPAQDDDRALQSFVRPAAAAPRLPAPDALQWHERLRAPADLGPPRLRSDDTALLQAAGTGQDTAVRQLLQRGANAEHLGDDGFTALGAAAFHGHRSTVRLLVRAGADTTRRGSSGQTALHLASVAGQLDVIDELLRLGVDIELLNRQRESALDAAASAGQLAAMQRLLQAGADAQRAGQR